MVLIVDDWPEANGSGTDCDTGFFSNRCDGGQRDNEQEPTAHQDHYEDHGKHPSVRFALDAEIILFSEPWPDIARPLWDTADGRAAASEPFLVPRAGASVSMLLHGINENIRDVIEDDEVVGDLARLDAAVFENYGKDKPGQTEKEGSDAQKTFQTFWHDLSCFKHNDPGTNGD